jgi:hypothetical protein
MSRRLTALGAALMAVVLMAPEQLKAPRPSSEVPPRFSPKLEAVAETKLVMEGVNKANYLGLERLLQQQPADDDTWRFIRGQALLIGEAGNLLMLRPPRSGGQEDWMRRATDLREAGANLARLASARDYDKSKAALVNVANVCNRCHQTFRVPTRVGPGAPGTRDAE